MTVRRPRTYLVVGFTCLAICWGLFGVPGTVQSGQGSGSDGLVSVGFSCRTHEPSDDEVRAMVDEVIEQVLGPQGLAAIIQPGDKVVIKPNMVSPFHGASGDKGRAIIADARVLRYLAEKVRAIIGDGGSAELMVVEAVGTPDDRKRWLPPPDQRFQHARLERTGNDTVDPGDVGYDADGDGLLDGGSRAKLVNLDSYGPSDRFLVTVTEPTCGAIDIYLPKILRTREQAIEAGEPDQYCDVLISVPTFKSHCFTGITGGIKNSYGFRYGGTFEGFDGGGPETARRSHRGGSCPEGIKFTAGYDTPLRNAHVLEEYLVALHRVRTNDFVLLDCLTGNRRGPLTPHGRPTDAVDYILTHAMMAATDSVAIDTVEALFAGYDQATVEFLERARLDGIGTDQPGQIRVDGLTRFTDHRRFLLDVYGPEDKYPFRDTHGDARLMSDFSPPTDVTVSEPTRVNGSTYSFAYTAREDDADDLGLARVELLVNGDLLVFKNTDLTAEGTLEADLATYAGGSVTVQLAAWDRAFNCALSDDREVSIAPQ
jgi:uncharacterized protein (DUF362 family)